MWLWAELELQQPQHLFSHWLKVHKERHHLLLLRGWEQVHSDPTTSLAFLDTLFQLQAPKNQAPLPQLWEPSWLCLHFALSILGWHLWWFQNLWYQTNLFVTFLLWGTKSKVRVHLFNSGVLILKGIERFISFLFVWMWINVFYFLIIMRIFSPQFFLFCFVLSWSYNSCVLCLALLCIVQSPSYLQFWTWNNLNG